MFGVCGAETSTRLEQKTVELAFYGLTAPSPVATCYSWQIRYHQKSADFLVTRFCVIGDRTVSGLGGEGHRTV